MTFLHSFQSEWLKLRRSSALWLMVVGGLFIPCIMLFARILRHQQSIAENSSEEVWQLLFNRCWQNMAIFVLPVGIILVASLIHQIEYRNNTWKQVLTSPQSLHTIFWSKFLVVGCMLLLFFVLFNIGIYLLGVLPAVWYRDVPFPKEAYPVSSFLEQNGVYLLEILPIVGIQYALSLHIRNFIIPIGVGLAMLIASLIAISWEHGYILPYNYAAIQFIMKKQEIPAFRHIKSWAVSYFFLALVLNYMLFLFKNEPFRMQYKKVVSIVLLLNTLWLVSVWGLSQKTSHKENTYKK